MASLNAGSLEDHHHSDQPDADIEDLILQGLAEKLILPGLLQKGSTIPRCGRMPPSVRTGLRRE